MFVLLPSSDPKLGNLEINFSKQFQIMSKKGATKVLYSYTLSYGRAIHILIMFANLVVRYF